MKKQFKKAIATVLTATMMMSVALPTFAANNDYVTDTTVNIVTNEAFQDLFNTNGNARSISGDMIVEQVAYNYTFAQQEDNPELADVTLSFVMTIGGQEYPVVASGVVNAYPLSSGDVLWENLIRGNVNIDGIECKVLVGFSKLDSGSDIQASVTIQAVNEEDTFNPVVFTFGEQVITANIQQEIMNSMEIATSEDINLAENQEISLMSLGYLNEQTNLSTTANFSSNVSGLAQKSKVYLSRADSLIAITMQTFGDNIDTYYKNTNTVWPTTLVDSYRISLELIRQEPVEDYYTHNADIEHITNLTYIDGSTATSGREYALRPFVEAFLLQKGVADSTITAIFGTLDAIASALKGTVNVIRANEGLSAEIDFGLTQVADFDLLECGVPIIYKVDVPESAKYLHATKYIYETSVTYRTQLMDYAGTAQWVYTDANDISKQITIDWILQ